MEEIIKETVEMYNEYLNRVVTGCNLIVAEIRKDNIDEAINLISELSKGIQWIEEVNHYLKLNSIQGYLDISLILEAFQEINQALIQKDYFLLADIFEYDIHPFFKEFNGIELN